MLPLASVTTTVLTVVGTVAVTGLPLASKIHFIYHMYSFGSVTLKVYSNLTNPCFGVSILF